MSIVLPPIATPFVDKNGKITQAWYQFLFQIQFFLTDGITNSNSTNSLVQSGTFVPVLTASTTNPAVTYTSQNGVWTRIGNMIQFHTELVINTIAGGTGNALLTLPIAVAVRDGTYTPHFATFTDGVDWGVGKQQLLAQGQNGLATMLFSVIANNAASTILNISGFAAGDTVEVSGSYETDQ
jgi:hypothetical protein